MYLALTSNKSETLEGVKSVTGEGVNNTDPENPVIVQNPTPSSILVTKARLSTLAVTNNTDSFVTAKVDNLDGVAPIYKGAFDQAVAGEASLKHSGPEQDYKIDISGTIKTLNPAFLGTFIVVKVIGDIQGEFTGGRKPYPVGVSLGGDAEVGFGITVYGKFPVNEVIRFQVSSSNAGNLVLSECIYFAQKIQPFK